MAKREASSTDETPRMLTLYDRSVSKITFQTVRPVVMAIMLFSTIMPQFVQLEDQDWEATDPQGNRGDHGDGQAVVGDDRRHAGGSFC
jgi:hypothetical protein